MANQEPERLLVNFLREQLTDLNSSRSGQWIFEDFPIVSLTNPSYPRVSVTKISESGATLGIFQDQALDSVVFQIDVFVKKDIVYTLTVTSETVGTISANLSLDYVPTTVTSISHDGTPFGSVTFVNTDEDFGTPSAGTVEISRSSGNLNFSAADISSYAGETITATYDVSLSNDKAAKWIARDVVNTMRTEWRTNRDVLGGLFYPQITQNINQPFDEVRRSF